MRATQRYEHVAISGLAHLDAPHVVTSTEIEEQLAPTLDRLGIAPGLLESLVRHRRAPGARQRHHAERDGRAGRRAGPGPQRRRPRGPRRAGEHLGVPRLPRAVDREHRARRDGAAQHGRELRRRQRLPGLPQRHERRRGHDRARRDRLTASSSTPRRSRFTMEATIARLASDECDEQMFREQFATLTLGSGAVAMVLSRDDSGDRATASSAGCQPGQHRARPPVHRQHLTRCDRHEGPAAGRAWSSAAQTWKEAVGSFELGPPRLRHSTPSTRSARCTPGPSATPSAWTSTASRSSSRSTATSARPPCPIVLSKAVEDGTVSSRRPGHADGHRQRHQRRRRRGRLVTALAGWPYATRRTDVGGHAWPTSTRAPGRPVLLVHGNPTWSFYYRSLLAALPAAGLRAIAPDHIGMGRSDRPSASRLPATPSAGASPTSAPSSTGSGSTSRSRSWRTTGAARSPWPGPSTTSSGSTGSCCSTPPRSRCRPASRCPGRCAPARAAGARRAGGAPGPTRSSLGALAMGTGRRWLPREARRGLLAPVRQPGRAAGGAPLRAGHPARPGRPGVRRARPHRAAAAACWPACRPR